MTTLEKAAQAKAVLDNPMFQQAMLEIKADLFEQFTYKTIWNGKRKREKIWDMMQAALEFEQKLTRALTDGKALIAAEERKRKQANVR